MTDPGQRGDVCGVGGVKQIGIFAGFNQTPVNSRWREPGEGETCGFLGHPCDLGRGWVQLDGFVCGQAGFVLTWVSGPCVFLLPTHSSSPFTPRKARWGLQPPLMEPPASKAALGARISLPEASL